MPEEKLKPLPYKIFCQKIKSRRLELGLSLREASEGIMSVSYLNDMEQGHRKPAKGEKIVALAKILKLDPKELLEMSGLIDEVKGWIEYVGYFRHAEKLVPLNREMAYQEFLNGQRQHQCPGYDCSVCSDVFDAFIANFGLPKDKLVPLDDTDTIDDLIYKILKYKYKDDAFVAVEIRKAIFARFGANKLVPLDKVKIYHLIKKYFLMIPGDDRPTNILQDTALDDACDEICARFGSVPVVPDVNWPEEKNSCSDPWHNVSTTDLYHARSCPKCHSIENNLGMQRNEGWNRAVKACKAAFDAAVKAYRN